MPTEAELVEALGISRNSVREALKALQALSIVEVRHGFGTYVGDSSLEPFAGALVFRDRKSLRRDRRELHEIVDVREALETGLIAQLPPQFAPEDVARLGDRLDVLRRDAGRGEAGDDADRAFHEALYAPLFAGERSSATAPSPPSRSTRRSTPRSPRRTPPMRRPRSPNTSPASAGACAKRLEPAGPATIAARGNRTLRTGEGRVDHPAPRVTAPGGVCAGAGLS